LEDGRKRLYKLAADSDISLVLSYNNPTGETLIFAGGRRASFAGFNR
jgi:hypothetical protein